jgi:hypothetical protein
MFKIHDFKERLAFSEKNSHEVFWQSVYKKAFPDMLLAIPCTGRCLGQELGIDRIVQLKSGQTIYIDEKKRGTVYNDILLEYISVDTQNKAGWIEKDLRIDYLAYAFLPNKKCYLFPYQLLRRVWNSHCDEWKSKFRKVEAKNSGYSTWSVAVPIDVITQSIASAMLIQLYN